MTSNQTDKLGAEDLNRRRLLQGIAATGAVTAAAGCLGDDDEETEPEETEPEDDETEPDEDEIQEGGRLEFAIERPNLDNYDQAESALADDTMIFNTIYDPLFRQDPQGEVIPWLAEEYEVEEAQDVSFPDDYTEYMGEYEIVDDEGDLPAVDTEWPNLVLPGGWHPDDLAAYGEGELGEGDTIRALSREDTEEAVDDGVFGTKVAGRLHEGVEFHNGTEMTAENVVRSYDRFVGSTNEGQIFGDFLHARAPEGDDGYEFELYAQEADAVALVDLPPFNVFFPDEHLDIEPGGLNPFEGGEVPIGQGPFEIAEFEEGSQLLLERTDNYWMEDHLQDKEWFDGDDDFPSAPVIDEINIRFVPEGGTRVASLQDREVDLSYQLPAGDRTAFDADDEFEVAAAGDTAFLFMTFPITEPGAFEHREIRDAVNHLIPRRDIVEIVSEGWGVPAEAPIPEPASGLGTQNETYEEFTQEDYAYPADPDVERAEELVEESPLDPPIEMVIRTNSDDEERQDKMQIVVDELNASGLFEASLETPGDIDDFFLDLIAPDSTETYAADNAIAVLGLDSGFDPHGYHRFTSMPAGYNACCNWFHGPGTFDWEEEYQSARFGLDVAQDPDARRARYDDLWPQITHDLGVTIVDYDLSTAVAGPRLQGFRGYPGRGGFLTHSLWAPYDETFAFIDEDA